MVFVVFINSVCTKIYVVSKIMRSQLLILCLGANNITEFFGCRNYIYEYIVRRRAAVFFYREVNVRTTWRVNIGELILMF